MFFITCCDKDNSIKQEDKLTQSKLNIQITSWSHLENSNNKIANEISIYKKSNLFKRDIRTSEHGFFIDDSKVQIIENSNFTTYTFFVFRENPESNILENYIYKAYNDGRHAQYLLKYHYSVDEENNKIYDTTVLDIEVIEDDNLIFSGASCVPEFTQVLDDIVCTSNTVCTGDGRHALGENCYCTPSPSTCDPAGSTSCELQYIWAYQGCGGGATGSYPDDNNNGNQTGGVGGTNGNNNDGEEEPTPAVPMELSVQDQILKCLNGFSSLGSTVTTFINPEIFESLNLSKFQWAEMNNYLQDNNCSEQAQQEVIDQLLEALENQCQANVQSQIAELTTQLGLSATTASCLASTNTDCLSVAALFNFSQNNPTETAFSKAAAETICNDGDVDYVNEILYYIDQKCAKKVVKSVLNNSSVLSQTILGYFSQDKDYIIKYKNDTLPLGIQGAVSPISSCVNLTCTIEIVLNNYMLDNSNDIFIAKVALHETLHAALLYLFETGQFVDSGLDPNVASDPDYVALVGAYLAYLFTNNPSGYIGSANDLQHQYMDAFVTSMVSVLQNMGTALGYSPNSPVMDSDFFD